MNNVASAKYSLKQYAQAKEYFKKSLAILASLYGVKSELYGMTSLNIPDVCSAMQESQQAGTWYRRAARALEYSRGPQDPDARKAAERQFSMSNKRMH